MRFNFFTMIKRISVMIFCLGFGINTFAKNIKEECTIENKFDENIPGYAGFISFDGVKSFRVVQDNDVDETQVADCTKYKNMYYALTVNKFSQSPEIKGKFIGIVKYNIKGQSIDRYYLNPDHSLCELNSKFRKTNKVVKVVLSCINNNKVNLINKVVN